GGTPAMVAGPLAAPPSAIAADGATLFFSSLLPGNVMTVPAAGGTPAPLSSETDDSHGIAVDATSVYWTDKGGGVWKAPRTGGNTTPWDPPAPHPTWGTAVDANNVYWTVPGSGLVKKLAK